MGIETIALIGLGIAAAGTGVQLYEGNKAAQSQKAALQEQQKAEALREQQMNLDAERRKRQMVRQMTIARSNAVSATTASGAQFGSGLAGAEAGISGQGNENLLGINQNQQIGAGIFAANRNMFSDYSSAASYSSMAGFGAGLSSLGSGMINNSGMISRVGSSFFGSNGSSMNEVG